ncbi:MAG: enoyl-[acyl-carrier-protein] reductase FabK [Peptococcaceae bacterium]|nr:enoyl-[acyl-carrier-protein] reductase FabK [Peptococcaceae bacterium]
MNRFDFFYQLGLKYPLFQGGMAWIADSSLAAAVSNAGGLGIIAAGTAPPQYVREQIRQVKQLTDKPFGVNIMLLNEFTDQIADLVCEEGVKVVTTGAGSPGKYIKKWKENGITVIPVVPSVAMARRMEKEGVDAVIAEGGESGGHVGELTTMALVPQVVDAVKIPVIAAGGIADGRGIAAALMLGASGVQLGTRFLVAKECTVHRNYKERVLKAKDTDTVVTGRPTGHPVRILKNKLARKFLDLERNCAPLEEYETLGVGALRRAVQEGDIEYGSVMAGQIAGLVKEEKSCREIIEELFAQTMDCLRRARDLETDLYPDLADKGQEVGQ